MGHPRKGNDKMLPQINTTKITNQLIQSRVHIQAIHKDGNQVIYAACSKSLLRIKVHLIQRRNKLLI